MGKFSTNVPRLNTNIDTTPLSAEEEKQPRPDGQRNGSTEGSSENGNVTDTTASRVEEKQKGQSSPIKTVKITPPNADAASSSDSSSSDSGALSFLRMPEWLEPVRSYFITNYSWIPRNWTWSKIKPVIRSALVAWISIVLFVIPKVERTLGSAAFLIVIFAFLLAPSDPFIATAEREFIFLFMCCLMWAWSCFGIFLANLARHVHVPNATLAQVIDGKYVEAAPSVIIGIFIFIGSAFLLWFRANRGPGPFFLPCIFAGLTMDICLTTVPLFPYPFYLIGSSILLPLVIHTALSLVSCLLIFPSTITALFTSSLSTSLAPVLAMLADNRKLLATSISSSDFGPLLAIVRKDTKGCEGSLVPLANARRLLKGDLIYARFAPRDYVAFQGMLKRLAGRADGLGVYFSLVDPSREKFPGTTHATPVPTTVGSPRGELSRATSRAPSIADNPSGTADEAQDDVPASLTSVNRQSVPLSPVASTALSNHDHAHHKQGHSKTHSTTRSHLFLHDSFISHNHHHHHNDRHSHGLHHRLLHSSLADLRTKKEEYAVGTFESQRYMNLESTGLFDPVDYAEWNETIQSLLKESCTPLLQACSLGMTCVKDWIMNSRDGRLPEFFSSIGFFHLNDNEQPSKATPASKILDLLKVGPQVLREERKRRKERVKQIREVREHVSQALQRFRTQERHAVIEPYRPAFEDGEYDPQRHGYLFARSRPPSPQPRTPVNEEAPSQEDQQDRGNSGPKEEGRTGQDQDESARREEVGGEYQVPPARCLFHGFIYQYSLIQITSIILEMLDEILRLEEARIQCRLWTPLEHIKAANWNLWSPAETVDPNTEDDDPDFIQGLGRSAPPPGANQTHSTTDNDMPSKITGPAFPVDPDSDLGIPKRRDPDHLPPRNIFETMMTVAYGFILSLGTGNALFALKGGFLSVALSLPSLIKHSAEFAYVNRFVWGIFMGQMALARFQGDTYFALWARVVSTFFGAIVGMVMWYIASGSGRGNPFGLAAVGAVCFPFFFYFRLYWPIPPLRNFMFFVTIILVFGYSYQNTHLGAPGNPGFGWSIAWKRFVLVTSGVSAAFFASFLPPATTIRRYQRNLLATTSSEIGTVYCSILSFANTKHEPEIQEIITSLLAVRNKLGRLTAMKANVGYEISLKGRWPADRYQRIVDLQTAISYSLSHLMSVLEHLDPAWSRAFLRRTRFMDPDFQGDVLAVISMISFALRTGCPLPQITPCPLADRFMLKYHGLSVIHKDSEEDYGLPRTLSIETLKNEQYLMFSVGIATAFGIVTRLDRLMVAVKEVVGEQYHIHGVGSARTQVAPGYTDLYGVHAAPNHGGVPMGSRTNTVHFDPPRRV